MDNTCQRNLALFRSLSPDSKENPEKKDKREHLGDQEELVRQGRLVHLGSKDTKALWDVMEKLAQVE